MPEARATESEELTLNRIFPQMRGRTLQGLGRIKKTLNSRNYRLFFSGQAISLTGFWMQRVAMGWLVYRITGSAFSLGLVDFIGQMPVFFLGSFTGVFLDRWDLRKVLFTCQTLAMIQAFLLAFLTLTGRVTFTHVLMISTALGLINAFELPARQSFVVHLIRKRDEMSNAIALNSVLFNAARLVGPSIAGVAIAALGEGICFMLNGFCYTATLAALLMMKMGRAVAAKDKGKGALADFRDGCLHAWHYRPIRNLLALVMVMSLTGIPYLVLLPAFAKEVLGGGPQTLGLLMAGTGIGAVGSALSLAVRRTALGLDRVIAMASVLFGVSLILLSFSRIPFLALLLIVPVGVGMNMSFISCNTLLQNIVDDDKRNRVMGFYVMVLMGLYPAGSFVAGFAADRVGTPMTFAVGGAICLIAAWAFAKQLSTFRQDTAVKLEA